MVVQDRTLKEISPRTIVYLRCRGSWCQLPDMLERLDRHMSKTSLRAIGPASGIYYNTPNEVSMQDLKWEVFYPGAINTPESSDDKMGVGIRNLAEAKMASILHRGPYRKAGSSYDRLEEWIKREGFKVCGPSEEVCLSVFGVPSEGQTMEIRTPLAQHEEVLLWQSRK